MTTKYTNKGLPNDPKIFPSPATWLSWVREGHNVIRKDRNGDPIKIFGPDGRHVGYEYDYVQSEDGKVRHHYTRAETRKSLMWLGRDSKYRGDDAGKFFADWAVYEFVDGEWVLRGSGKKGEYRKHNEWFAMKVSKEERVHPFDKAQEQRAIESILKAAG